MTTLTLGSHGPVTVTRLRVAVGRSLWLPLACLWLLTLITFSAPGREGPAATGSLDLIGLAKLAVRGVTLVTLPYYLFRHWTLPRRRVVTWCLLPFGLYLGWAIVSVAWSALKPVSLGQAGGLAALLLLTASVGVGWSGPASTERLLRHLSLALLGVSAIILAAHLIDRDLSGLNRENFSDIENASAGIVHPTSAGATASLGLVILVAARLLWDWKWPRALLVPGLFLHVPVLLLANSRTAIGMGAAVLLPMLCFFSNRTLLAVAALVLSAIGIVYLAADPRMEVAEDAFGETATFLKRGETAEQLTSLTGRTALWEAVWKEFCDSPLIGHGYFVTSAKGELDVWSGPANRTAHNVVLQVLVTTGVVGCLLFLWALGRPALAAARRIVADREQHPLGWLLLMLAVWYAGWGMLCESFMGPIQPESVTFFTMFGLALAAAAPREGTR